MIDKRQLMQAALEFGNSPELSRAFDLATQDRDIWASAKENPTDYLRSQGIELPRHLQLQFLGDPHLPVPDFDFFTINHFNCRTFWVKKRDEPGYEQVELCVGFELVPKPFPGGTSG